jgi:hypothetical protein
MTYERYLRHDLGDRSVQNVKATSYSKQGETSTAGVKRAAKG